MQVKKFEAPTIQEALETIKRELGPEAIILQTKQHKRGFGLLSKASVEVTAAVSERAIQKKAYVEERLPPSTREAARKLPADRQAGLIDRYTEARDSKASAEKQASEARARITSRKRYVDIDDEESAKAKAGRPWEAGASPASPRSRSREELPEGQGASAAAAKRALNGQAAGLGAVVARPGVAVATTRTPPPAAGAIPAYASMPLEEEVRQLKRMITDLLPGSGPEMTGGIPGVLGTPPLKDVFEQLVLGGIDKRYALALVRKAAFELGEDRSRSPDDVLDQVADEIMSSTEVLPGLAAVEPGKGSPLVIALVGPTGVGKTTTVAKIASEALHRRGLKTGLINFDDYKVAAFDQLATYAKILNVPFRSASSAEDLKAAVADFSGLDLVLVDTTGRSQRDQENLLAMSAMLRGVPGLQCHLVLSSTTRDAELHDMCNRFAPFLPQGLIASKLDEATTYGAIYNVSQKSKLPLLYFTTGQRVPEDLEEATCERLAALIMDL